MPLSPSLRTDPFFTISIKHLPTDEQVTFEGWVTQFQDAYSSNWNSQNVYGRMDPLVTFENTQRTITLGFDVVSDNMDAAINNLININRLIEFQYPMYSKVERSAQNTLKAAPLLGLKWTNLISNAQSAYFLYGYIQGGVTYAPDMGEGGFILRNVGRSNETIPGSEQQSSVSVRFGADPLESLGVNFDAAGLASLDRAPGGSGANSISKVTKENSYIPKKVSLNFTFGVLHTHLTGFDKYGSFGGSESLSNKFPNAAMLRNTTSTITSDTAAGTETTINQALDAELLENN